LADINFEQVHAELMAALDGIAAGKKHCDFVEVPQAGTKIKILHAVQRGVQFLYESFEPNVSTLQIERTPNSARPVNQSDKMKSRERSSQL
jgi:hypothetical protein